MEHYNIQVNIQKVSKPAPTSSRGLTAPPSPEREVTDVLKLAIAADTEAGAYDKVQGLLDAYRPHQHRASCHGPAGELQCGEEG